MTKKQFIQVWKQYGMTLINEEYPNDYFKIKEEQWQRFGEIMFKVKRKFYPKCKLEDEVPCSTECRQYPRAYRILVNPFGVGNHVGILYENWVELK
jgi:hypothetical protein